MTAEELTQAMQNRQVLLADIKKKREEYQASKAAASTAFSAPAAGAAAANVKAGGFNF